MTNKNQRKWIFASVFWVGLTAAALVALARWLHPATFAPDVQVYILIGALAAAVAWLKDTYV